MDIQDCNIAGLKRIHLKVNEDKRGLSCERFNSKAFSDAGLPTQFAQDFHSRSLPGVLRGLHYQTVPPQGKLVSVMSGRIWDVALDVRPGSLTFGKYFKIELSGDNGVMLWIPAGFAHGFCVLGDTPADVLYKIDLPYAPGGEGGIRYDDKDLQIPWPIKNPTISDRDAKLGSWNEYTKKPPVWSAA
jgi:dTDP-4-dehydrorhamnose 3,5-epimerase